MRTHLSLQEVAGMAPKLMSQELRMLLVLAGRGPMGLVEVATGAGLSLVTVRRSSRALRDRGLAELVK